MNGKGSTVSIPKWINNCTVECFLLSVHYSHLSWLTSIKEMVQLHVQIVLFL